MVLLTTSVNNYTIKYFVLVEEMRG